jgi:Rieske Fe-S protein
MVAGLPPGERAEAAPVQEYGRVALTWPDGSPVSCTALEAGREFIFFYPYRSTPCFLLRLDAPVVGGMALSGSEGRTYRWQGGVGPDRAVVAYSAICAHKLSHPSRAVSFIGYRPQAVGFLVDDNRIERRAGVIQCCSEHSIYDPARGAAVLAGPAPHPLAAVALEETDSGLMATAVYGEPVFDRYFERFGYRLGLEFGADHVREQVADSSVVQPTETFTRQQIQC